MADRIECDADCPQEARVHVAKFDENDKQVHYCGHHGDRFMEGLRAWGIVTDDRLEGKVLATIPAPADDD